MRPAFVLVPMIAACTSVSGLSGGGGDDDAGSDAGTIVDATPDSPSDDAVANDAGDASSSSYRAAVIEDAPVGYWRLGEPDTATKAKDEMGAHDGIYQGTFSLAVDGVTPDGDFAASFAGTTGSVQLGDVLDFTAATAITLEAWVKVELIDNDYRRVIAKRGNGGGYAIFCQETVGGCAFELIGGSNAVCNMSLTTGGWHHLVGTYDGVNVKSYLDGIQTCSKPASITLPDLAQPLVFGALSTGGNYFKGVLDEIAIYDKALGPKRVTEHYARGKP